MTSAAKQRAWRKRNPDKVRDHNLRQRYGITTEDRNALLRKQRGRCAGCRTTRAARWVVDHNHKNKKIRGILCNHCNLVLGHAKDNANTLRRLACYLEK